MAGWTNTRPETKKNRQPRSCMGRRANVPVQLRQFQAARVGHKAN